MTDDRFETHASCNLCDCQPLSVICHFVLFFWRPAFDSKDWAFVAVHREFIEGFRSSVVFHGAFT